MLVIFQNVATYDTYCWNGHYPVGVTPYTQAWNTPAEVTDQEVRLFQALETSKARTFELKERGKFSIISRVKLPEDDNRD